MIKTPSKYLGDNAVEPKYESVKKLLKLHKINDKKLHEILEMLEEIKHLADDIRCEINLIKKK